MYNNINYTANRVEEVRPNPVTELANIAIDMAEGDADKAMDYFYSMSLFLPSNSKPMTKEEVEKTEKKIKKLKERNKKLEEEWREELKKLRKSLYGI